MQARNVFFICSDHDTILQKSYLCSIPWLAPLGFSSESEGKIDRTCWAIDARVEELRSYEVRRRLLKLIDRQIQLRRVEGGFEMARARRI